jgi:uncharacterized membrane protein
MGAAKESRWASGAQIRIILLVSLGLNLFLGGYLAGAFLNRSMHPPNSGPGGPPRLQSIADRVRGQISADGVQKIDGLIAEIEGIFRKRGPGGGSGDVRSQLEKIVSDDVFDQKAFLDVIDRMNIARTTSDREIANHVASVLSQLSPKDRRILAAAVLNQMPPPPPPPPR